jgi:DNA-binding transcriptional LysR family regulator
VQIQYVLYFLAVAKKRSFTLASHNCSVAQPSLSNGIRDLDAYLGGPLFHRERGRNGVVLTELGRVIRPHFVRIARSIAQAERQAADYRPLGNSSNRLASISRAESGKRLSHRPAAEELIKTRLQLLSQLTCMFRLLLVFGMLFALHEAIEICSTSLKANFCR